VAEDRRDDAIDTSDESLAEAFWGVARLLRGRSRDSLAPWNITPSHSRALGVLIRHGSIRLSELAEHLRIAPRSATEVVDGLEAQGLVERHADPHDRRATLVAPTTAGAEVGAAIRAARSAEAERIFAELSASDRVQLGRILRKLRS
jgi:DNA-binding MarR family transcriptional regulator